MARPARAEYPGSYHHVTTRGVARGDIFFTDADRLEFLGRLAEAHQRWGLVFHGYCLMTNHYHLQVETPNAGLSQAFGWINQNHAIFVNRRTGRDGSAVSGRVSGDADVRRRGQAAHDARLHGSDHVYV